MQMRKLSISSFSPLDAAHPDFLFFRNAARTSATIYLARHLGKLLLIDAGDGLDALSFSPDACFLTHGHYDHTRGVKKEWNGVYIHPSEDPHLPYVEIPANARALPSHEFAFGPYTFEILHTPGHTPGSICLFEPRLSILFSGDTLFASGVPGRTDLGGSQKLMEESLEMLRHLDWKLLCPGHGELERAGGQTF